jgi:aspartate/methionine/tyrosine aminotransferase
MRFSKRLPWERQENELSRLVAARRASARPFLNLTGSNPTAAGIPYQNEAIVAALSDPASLTYEPTAEGLPSAREAVARYQRVDPRRVLLTASTSEAYALLFKLLCDPGDEILVPRPSYPLFEFLAALDNVAVRQYSLRYHEGWWLDGEGLRQAVTPRTRAIVTVHPNNPTGSFVKRGELDLLASLGLPILSDEVFADYAFDSDPERVPSLATESRVPVFALGGFSKALGLPQMKLGWIIHNGAPEIQSKLELIADTYLSVSAPIQHAAAKWLGLREEFQHNLMTRLRTNLAAGPEALRIEGGWNAILRLPATRTEEDWTAHLLEHCDVLVQPGYFYDFEMEPYIVVSLLTAPSTFAEGIRRIREAQ